MKFAGRDFRCELLIAGIWYPVDGERSTSAKINNEQVDTTDNGGVPWRALSPCGIRSGELSVSGVMTNGAVVAALQTAVFNGTNVTARIKNGFEEKVAEGPYFVSAFERGGEYNGAETFTASLASASATVSEPPIPMIFTIDTRKSAGAAGHTIAKHFKLPLTSAGSYNFLVDWGDGTSSAITTWNDIATEHIYPDDQVYTVSILGRCSVWYFDNNGDRLKVISVLQWGNAVTSQLRFYGCANLVSVSGSATDYPRVTNFGTTFRGCTSLTTFPPMNTSNVTSFSNTWRDCTGLTSFSALDMSKATQIDSAWQQCTHLVVFPLIITSDLLTKADYAWSGCGAMTSFPGMVGHPAYPAVINLGKVTNFSASWNGCYGLQSFPAINTMSGLQFVETWLGCTGLAGSAFPALDMRAMTSGARCFGVTHPTNGWAMATAAYDALLNKLYTGPAANPNPSVTFGGGNSKYTAAAVTAHDYLAITRTWSITDGGLLV